MTLAIKTLTVLLLLTFMPFTAEAWNRLAAFTFATLPPGEAHPEGITVDADGNVYVTTFDVNRAGTPGEVGHLIIFDRAGRLVRRVLVQNSTPLLLDLAFTPGPEKKLLIIDFGGAKVLSVNPVTGASTVFTTIPDDPAIPGTPGPNVLTFDDGGRVYISDSFQGVIWRTGPAGGAAVNWVTSPLLRTSGVPPFGANGLAFNNAQNAMFVANTGNDTVVKIPVTSGTGGPVAGTPAVFVNSINGADGLIIDQQDRIWVAANQADEIVVLEPTQGRAIAKLGDFEGIVQGAPRGLLFPASIVFDPTRLFLYVTNLALDLKAALGEGNQTVDSPWAAQVTTHTISRIPAVIIPLPGQP